MKKILLMLISFIFPFIVYANTIDNYYINATIKDNGDLLVEEYFYIDGTFNGMERIINYKNINAYDFVESASSYGGSKLHNGNGIEILEVRALPKDENFDFENIDGNLFSKVSSASKGDYEVYTENRSSYGSTIRIFLPSYKDEAFYIKYLLKDMAILHNDVGELGWNVVGDSLANPTNNLIVKVNIPDNKNIIKVWGHGPLNGYTKILSNSEVTANITDLSSNAAVDIRVAFDKNVIKNSSKKSNVDALDKIIKYETSEAEKANYEREINELNTIHSIDYLFKALEKTPSFYNYSELNYLISSLNNIDKKNEYYTRLYQFQDKVDDYEYKIFKEKLDMAYYDYYYYEEASEIIDNIFNEELKLKMQNELKIVKNKIVKREVKNELGLTIVSLSSIGLTYLVYYLKIKLKKIKKAKVDPLYIREIPSSLPAECVGLLTDSVLNGNEVSAALLDLIRRKIISFEKKENGSFDLIYNFDNENITEDDKEFAVLIFKRKQRVNSKKIGKIDYEKFNRWKKTTINKLRNKFLILKYDEESEEINGNLLTLGIVFLISPLFFVGIILITIFIIQRYKSKFFIWLFIPLNIILIILSLFTNHFIKFAYIFSIVAIILIKIMIRKFPTKLKIKKTEKGIEEANKWNGLRNYLIDFSIISDREIPEIELWEKYLVYATAFGIGKEVLNSMKIKLDNEKIDINMYDNYIIFNNINEIGNVISSVNSVSAKAAASSAIRTNFPSGGGSGGSSFGGGFSSGSGGGGGFSGGSSGGGSFGGGGGGGTF